MENKCKDCANLSARDVFNGVCVLSKDKVLIDNAACDKFVPVHKCKYCAKYQPDAEKENIGTCDGIMVFPDLTGCEDYVATGE